MVKEPAFYADRGAMPRVHEAANIVATYNAMTGNQKRQAVRAAGCTYWTRRRTHAPGDFRIGEHGPRGNLPYSLPDLDLEGRAFVAERKIESEARVLQKRFELSAGLPGESRLRLEQRRTGWKVIDAHYLLPCGPYGEYGERRRDLGLPRFQQGIHYLRSLSMQPHSIRQNRIFWNTGATIVATQWAHSWCSRLAILSVPAIYSQRTGGGAQVTDLDRSKISTCSFEATQLHAGDRLQLQFGTDNANDQHYTTLIGFVPGHSVLVRTPLVQHLPIPVPEGANVLVRAFSGRHAFTFESRVERVCRSPYAYMHIAYPAQVQRTTIRGALRVRIALPGIASDFPGQADQSPQAVLVSDLSVSGAQLESDSSLGGPGGKFGLAFKFVVQPNNYEVKLTTSAQIQSVRPIKPQGKGAHEVFSHGVRFEKLHATEGLLLQSYIQQVLLADRSRVV